MPKKTSPKVVARNRKNAGRSTGPRTAAGKAVSRRNSLKHGLTANPAAGVIEDPGVFDRLFEDLCCRIKPGDELEKSLTRRIAVALWRQQRVERVETAAARQAVAAQVPHADRVQAWVSRLNGAWFDLRYYEETDAEALAEGRARGIAPRREVWRRFRRPGLERLDALRATEVLQDAAGIDALLVMLDDLTQRLREAERLIPIEAQQLAWLLGESAERLTADDLSESDREGMFFPDERPWATDIDRLIGEARNRNAGSPIPAGLMRRIECRIVSYRQQRRVCTTPGDREAESDRRAMALLPSAADLDRLIRYESHADRTLTRSLETLARLRGVSVQTVLARVLVQHPDGSGYEVSRQESVWQQGAPDPNA